MVVSEVVTVLLMAGLECYLQSRDTVGLLLDRQKSFLHLFLTPGIHDDLMSHLSTIHIHTHIYKHTHTHFHIYIRHRTYSHVLRSYL